VDIGDGLYSDQPFIAECKGQGMSFTLVAKPADHKVLFESVEEVTVMGGWALWRPWTLKEAVTC
jgi:hypothetical protein